MSHLRKTFNWFLFSITPVLVCIGLILNLLTIMVFSRLKMRKYCMSISMICLAVLTISVLLSWLDERYYSLYYLNNTIWCNLHGYVDMVACANSSWIIIIISIERWFAVCKPWQKSRVFTNNRVGIALLCLFITSVVIFAYFPFLMGVVINECKIKHDKYYECLGFISIFLIYFLPFIILAILNAMILYRLRVSPFSNKVLTLRNKSFNKSVNAQKSSHSVKKKDNLPLNNYETTTVSSTVAGTAQSSTTVTQMAPQIVQPIYVINSKNDRSLSVTLLTVSITFMILTFPFQINWIVDNIQIFDKSNVTISQEARTTTTIPLHANSTEIIQTNQEFYYRISFLIKNMNYVINFFLYSALSTLFRQEFLAIFKESRLFACAKCINYKRVITEAKFSKRSSMSEIVFPVNSSLNKNGQNTYLKIRIEPTNLAKFLKIKKTTNIQNEIVNNDLRNETISTKITKKPQSTGEIIDSFKKEKKLLIKELHLKQLNKPI